MISSKTSFIALIGNPVSHSLSPIMQNAAVHVTKSSGGEGAFREAVEWILAKQGRLEEVIEDLRNKVLSP